MLGKKTGRLERQPSLQCYVQTLHNISMNPNEPSTTIRTFTGKQFDYSGPTQDQICIEDIAHGLSMQSRWGGQCPVFYSVAQHSIACAKVLHVRGYKADVILQALMHDASEAYMCDLPRPLKQMIPQYKTLETAVMFAIKEKFGLKRSFDPVVKEVDEIMLQLEWQALILGNCKHNEIEEPMSPEQAKLMFMEVYNTFCINDLIRSANNFANG